MRLVHHKIVQKAALTDLSERVANVVKGRRLWRDIENT
jgi:hypothetical protein